MGVERKSFFLRIFLYNICIITDNDSTTNIKPIIGNSKIELVKISEIDEKCNNLCVAHNSHVEHTESVFRKIQYSICENQDAVKELNEKIDMLKDIEINIAKKNNINTKKYETIKMLPKEQIKEEEKIVKNDGNTEDLYSDPVFALCPSYAKGEDLREAIKDLRIILIKFKISKTEDIELLDQNNYDVFIKEYDKYLKECKKGKYHHNFIVRFWRWIKS